MSNKVFIFFDLLSQTCILLLVGGTTLASLDDKDHAYLIWMAITGIAMGLAQIFSAIGSIIRKLAFRKLRLIYLAVSSVYLFIAWVSEFVHDPGLLRQGLLYGIPVTALFYYSITVMTLVKVFRKTMPATA